jgi:hypothetical protein
LQPTHNTPRKGPKFLDTKVFIAALAVAITVGFWTLFSNNAFQPVEAAPAASITQPVQPDTDEGQDFPPLPTLVPLIDVTLPVTVNAAPVTQVQSSNQSLPQENPAQPKAKTALRAVIAPTQVIIQKGPIVQQSVDTVSSSNGGSNSGGGKKSSATTKSSKK